MLINCTVYQAGSKLAEISIDEISEYKQHQDCFIWVALKDPEPGEIVQMQERFDLHELAVEDAVQGRERPKIEEYGDSIFTIMHLVDLIDGEVSIGEMSVFAGRNYVISVRRRSNVDFLGVRYRCERDPELLQLGPGFVLYALMDSVVDRYFPIIDLLESELEVIEDKMFSKDSVGLSIERLYDLKRKVIKLRHAVSPLMEAVGRASSGRVPLLFLKNQNYFRDIYDHLDRINASIDTIRDTIGTAIQVDLAMVSIEENDVNKRLSAWAGIFAVATVFTGIWGMNFKAMPELDWTLGYPMAIVTIAVACGGLYYRFKRSGWL